MAYSHSPGAAVILPKSVADHWRLYLIEGLVFIVLGIGAVMIPVFASLAADIFLGWLFLAGGVVGVVTTLMGHHAPGFWWSLFSSTLAVVVGLLLVGWQIAGVISLTLVIAIFFAADGIVSILFAIEHRRNWSHRWGWFLASGIVDLGLAAMIVWLLPFGAPWLLGLIVGIDFIFGGTSMFAVGLAARNPRVSTA